MTTDTATEARKMTYAELFSGFQNAKNLWGRDNRERDSRLLGLPAPAEYDARKILTVHRVADPPQIFPADYLISD